MSYCDSTVNLAPGSGQQQVMSSEAVVSGVVVNKD